MCVLLFLGDWKGGDLILFEPGLRFTVSRGDILMFPSAKFTHFNMHYEGARLTFVFHTDRDSRRWIESRNGWEQHINSSRTIIREDEYVDEDSESDII